MTEKNREQMNGEELRGGIDYILYHTIRTPTVRAFFVNQILSLLPKEVTGKPPKGEPKSGCD